MKESKTAFFTCLLCSLCYVQAATADVYAGRSGALGDANIIIGFLSTQAGNASPNITLGGANTGLKSAFDIVFDANEGGVFYVADFQQGSVSVFSRYASGNFPPERVSTSASMAGIRQVLVFDQDREMVILSPSGVITFPNYVHGIVSPIRSLGLGPITKIDNPKGLAYSATADELFIGDEAQPSPGTYVGEVLVFPRSSDGSNAPSRTISGNLTTLGYEIYDLAINPVANELYVLCQGNSAENQSALLTFSLNATGNAAPIRLIRGSNTQLNAAWSLAYDSSADQLVVTGISSATLYPTLLFFPRSANGNVAPLKVISGSNTGLLNNGEQRWWSVIAVDFNMLFKNGFE